MSIRWIVARHPIEPLSRPKKPVLLPVGLLVASPKAAGPLVTDPRPNESGGLLDGCAGAAERESVWHRRVGEVGIDGTGCGVSFLVAGA